MEDGLKEAVSCTTGIDNINNGVDTTIMSNFPEGTVAITKDEKSNLFEPSDPKLNGSVHSSDEADDDSEADALVIDESVPKRRVKKRKRSTKSKSVNDNSAVDNENEIVIHSNPYFNESLFELSQQHHNSHDIEESNKTDKNKSIIRANKLKRVKHKNTPKLREYAQYLGLQPAVQFKCSKCQQAGFESLPSLNEHLLNCTADPNAATEVEDNSVSSFKLTRKVFLCSACGTYYENWNLYMHMLEFHRRFICLYCLGMFSVLDDLCQHIQSRHNWEPQQRETPDDFFKEYKEPCFIICCECKKLFNERDNFFYHNCVQCDNTSAIKNVSAKNNKNKCVKQQIRPENHVTGDSIADNLSEINCLSNTTEVISGSKDSGSNIPMVRSEVSNTETSEVLPEVPNFDPKNTEIDSQTSLPDMENIIDAPEKLNSDKNHLETEKQESDLDESLSMETNDKQTSLNLTADFVNNSSAEETTNNENFGDDVKSPDDFKVEGYDQSSRGSDLKSIDEENSDLEQNVDERLENMNGEETRKVPKLSLKLPKLDTFSNVEPEDSDDSDKLGMEVDQIESENEYCNLSDEKIENIPDEPHIQVAGPDVNIVELELEHPLDKFEIKVLLQKCLLATVSVCVYCNHARKISTNGKQLGLHAIAEHRYSAIVNSITAEELIPESFVARIKESLDDLDNIFFNLESNLSEEGVTFSHVFECFQCRYATNIHKELYLHNRKMHTKTLLLCIMCKSNFYSYSELICHLCPGDYVLDHELQFRCCMCVNDDLPSSFRLMVHLRKRHHACDVCLEMCNNQYKLSNHVWKHKLHHFCYRCGIAYRNKQDITRHLFWKHGTESVLCKKCLQKKWPHVFHFCIPPTLFTCEECNLNFSKAVYLKVHKRIHSNEKPHSCTFEECEQSFVSKKLLQKHEQHHLQPLEEEKVEEKETVVQTVNPEDNHQDVEVIDAVEDNAEDKPKPKVDVYDLPELNLSESSDSESENEAPKPEVKRTEEENIIETLEERTLEVEQELANRITVANEENQIINQDTIDSSVPILESIWDDFKIYQAKKEKIDNLFGEPEKEDTEEGETEVVQVLTAEVALRDHDYFYNPETSQDTNVITEVEPDLSQRVDHDYCTPQAVADTVEQKEDIEKPEVTDKKPNLDSSSSDSDSSSCSCGSNCSCSTSSSSTSSSDSSDSDSSTEEGRRKQQARREKKKNKSKQVEKKEEPSSSGTLEKKPVPEAPILETDLDTAESETDEEFYDKQPQKLAKKLLEEKRNQILAEVGSLPNGGFFENSRNSTPSLPEEIKPKKKSKSKKRKKKKNERKEVELTEHVRPEPTDPPYPFYQTPTVAPLTISLNKMSPLSNQGASTPPTVHIKMTQDHQISSRHESETNKRASKRRRVPNKFYGYSSDEDGEKQSGPPAAKWRKPDTQTSSQASPFQSPPMLVPPLTIKTGPNVSQPTVEPITIRPTAKPGELRVHQRQSATPRVPPLQISAAVMAKANEDERDTDSNDSATEEVEEVTAPAVVEPPKESKGVQLYCYCRCPYDEVSEMIGCDSHDCAIEWFHFECVGIMVPPKGQWFCPDCRKRKQQRRELMQA